MSKAEFAGAVGLPESSAQGFYEKLRAYKKARASENLKRGLYVGEGVTRALAGREAPKYAKDWMSPEQVTQLQNQMLGGINQLLEGRRKDKEAYRRALIQAAVSIHGDRTSASKAKMQIAGQLLLERTKALQGETRVVGGSGSGGKNEAGHYVITSQDYARLVESARNDIEPGVEKGVLGFGGYAGAKNLLSRIAGAHDRKTGEDLDIVRASAEGSNLSVEGFQQKWLEHAVGGKSVEEIATLTTSTGKPLIPAEGVIDVDAYMQYAKEQGLKQERITSFQTLMGVMASFEQEKVGGSGDGKRLATIPGIDDEEYARREGLAEKSLSSLGAGGGKLTGIVAELLQSGPLSNEKLAQIETQLKGEIGKTTSQGEEASGRTPSGEGGLPPGASGGKKDVRSPGADMEREIEGVIDPDVGLQRLWEAYENLANTRTSAKDIHLLKQLQSSPEMAKLKAVTGIQNDKAALRAAMMMSNKRRRDERFNDASKIKNLRQSIRRDNLTNTMSGKRPPVERPPRTGTDAAGLTAGAGNFELPKKEEEQVG